MLALDNCQKLTGRPQYCNIGLCGALIFARD